MASVSTKLGRIEVAEHGRGPAVVLWHSLLCDGSMWRHQVPALAADHRVLVVDGPGHGASAPSAGPFTLEDCAAVLLEVLDAHGVEKAALVGLSWGGMTAMRVALRAPARVSHLALFDTSADEEAFLARTRYRFLAALYRRFGLSSFLERAVLEVMFAPATLRDRPQVGRELVERIRSWDREGVAHAIRAVVIERSSIWSELPSIHGIPTLVAVGDEDRATLPFRSERIARAIPDARLERIAGAGHLSAVEKPEVVNRLLVEFLRPSV
jgi:3-oxoadipate enol-lactonase